MTESTPETTEDNIVLGPNSEVTFPGGDGSTYEEAGASDVLVPAGEDVPVDPADPAWVSPDVQAALDGEAVVYDISPEGTTAEVQEGNNATILIVTLDPSDNTIEDIKAHVEAHPEEAAAMLRLEQQGQNRVTLVEWLQEQVAV